MASWGTDSWGGCQSTTAHGGANDWNSSGQQTTGAGDWNAGAQQDTGGGEWNSGGEQATGTNQWNSGEDGNNNKNDFGGGQFGGDEADAGGRGTQEPGAFDGTCNLCGKDGHRKRDCPEKPPQLCANCQEEGHSVNECENPRKIDRSDVQDLEPAAAMAKINEAVADDDMFDAKEAIRAYVKALPNTDFVALENALRKHDVGVFLIAMELEMEETMTNMDLQGNLGKKYSVTYRFSGRCPRPRDRQAWPKDAGENLERLKEAGDMVKTLVPRCRNCDALGHDRRQCPEDPIEKQQQAITCFNCGETGHRVRDCTTPRVDKFACKNCNKSGHTAKECPEPRPVPEDLECTKCGEIGKHWRKDCPQGAQSRACHNCGAEDHMSRDCTEPRRMKCRNCDEFDHVAKDCPKPRDMSRVKCMNCSEMGHFKSKCPKPVVEDDAGDAGNGGFDNGGLDNSAGFDNGGDGGSWNAPTAADNGWQTSGGGAGGSAW
ncbi:hypothetical protein MCOR11_008647 [Pyricularia oryzae]|nr:hypothetical protein MCOR11_008647 [Pyricularia oryzae]